MFKMKLTTAVICVYWFRMCDKIQHFSAVVTDKLAVKSFFFFVFFLIIFDGEESKDEKAFVLRVF